MNSSFGLFFFSSVVLSLVTWSYAELNHSIEQRSAIAENIKKLDTEINYRIQLIDNYFNSECSEHESVNEKTFSDIREIYNAGPKYRSIFSQNENKRLHILVWERSSLLEDTSAQQKFINSFEQLTSLYAYLNRFVDQTSDDGMFYSTKPDYWAEITMVKACFSNSTNAIEKELKFEVKSDANDSSTNHTSSATNSQACANLSKGRKGSELSDTTMQKKFIQTDHVQTAEVLAPNSWQNDLPKLLGIADTSISDEDALNKPFLMAIEDVFSISGRGTVVTGQIERGIINLGDEIEILGIKQPQTATVTGIEMFRKILDQGRAGENIGLMLRGVKRSDVERGQVLVQPGSITSQTKFVAKVYILSKEEGGRHTPFENGYRPQFYFRTTDITGTVKLPKEIKQVLPGQIVEFNVELSVAMVIEKGQQFKIREGGRAVGAGIVIDVSTTS